MDRFMFWLTNSMNKFVSEVLSRKISKILCFGYQIKSISDESAKLRRLHWLHGWVKKLHGSGGSSGFIRFWRGTNILRGRMCMHKCELNFSDFCRYSCISEINFPKMKRTKKSVKSSTFVSSINSENRLISYISEHRF